VVAATLLAGPAPRGGGEGGVIKLAAGLLFLGLNFYTYYYFATAESRPERVSFDRFPLEVGEWSCRHPERMPPETEENLGVTDYVVCQFERPSRREVVSVYVGYHASQVRKEGGGSNETMIHPPAHCLPGSGWDIIASGRVSLDLPGLPVSPAEVNRLVIAKGDERQLVYYWYQERGRVISADWRKIVDLFWDRATRHRTDGALVRFTAPIGGDGEAEADQAILAIAREVTARLPSYVPN
jgi:EpsI family protein